MVIDEAVAPTCTTTGLTEGKHCSVCNEVLVAQEEVSALGHDEIAHEAQAATCTEIGWNAYVTCSRCDYTTYEELEATGHTEVIDAAVAPTCTATGLTEGKHCSVCDEVLVAQQTVEALGHALVDVDGKEATCTEAGYTAYQACSRCDHTVGKETIDALGHTEVIDEAVAPTCTTTGLTEGSHCSVCDEVLVAQQTVEATGHNYICHVCSICDTRESSTNKYTFSDYDAGTQYAENEEHVLDENVTIYTTQCHFTTQLRIYSSSTHNGYAIIKSSGVITALDFNAGNKVDTLNVYGSTDGESWTLIEGVSITSTSYKDYSITITGSYTYLKLDVDGDQQVRLTSITLTTATFGHDDAETTETRNEATCTEAGSIVVTCNKCGETISSEEIPATGHDWEDATCEEPKTCSVCDATEGEALGHDWIWVIDKEATFEEEGKKHEKCQICNATQNENTTIDKLTCNHTMAHTPAAEANCTEDGNNEYWYCAACDKYFSDANGATEIAENSWVISALGHNMTATEENTATCEEAGNSAYWTCGNCDKYFSDANGENEIAKDSWIIDALGHADENGDYVCDRCEETVAPEADTTLTIAQAIALGQAYAHNTYTSGKYYVTGTIKEVYNTQYGNMRIYVDDIDTTFTIYGTYSADGETRYDALDVKPIVGDQITVYGIIGQYSSASQMKNGWITAHTAHEHTGTATCTEAAKCTICGQSYGEALGHTEVVDEAVAPTCTETGLTQGSHCSVCGEVTVAQEEIPATGEHTYVDGECKNCGALENCLHKNTSTITTNATCGTAGSIVTKCNDCEEITSSEEIPATGEHDYENRTCTVCGLKGPSMLVTTEIAFEFGANGSATHVDGNDLGASKSYTADGYTLALTNMSKVYGPAYDAKGNSCIKLGTSSVTATLTFIVPDSVSRVIINIAGYKANKASVSINGITYSINTCSNNGEYTEITIDTTSEKSISLSTNSTPDKRAMINSIIFVGTAEACAHEYTETVQKEPTCTESGETIRTCIYGCGQTETLITEATGHAWNNGEITTEATCTEDGEMTYTCTANNCGETKTEEIPATGEHTYVDGKCENCGAPEDCAHENTTTETVGATCLETGLTTITCTKCKEIISSEVIPALDHAEVIDAAVEATCTQTGLTEGKHCSRCDEILVAQEEIPVTDHNYVDGTCTGCGKEEPKSYDVAIDIFSTTGALSSDKSKITWTNAAVTVTNKKGSTAIRTSDADHFRAYANSQLVISVNGGTLVKVVITCTSGSYATVMQTSATNAGLTATVSDSVVTITCSDVSEIAFNLTAQSRINKIDVTYTA